MYLLAYDAPTARRYAVASAAAFPTARDPAAAPRACPQLWVIRTTSDYFAGEGLGLPADRVALANRLGLLLVPRFQNDEGFTPAQIRKRGRRRGRRRTRAHRDLLRHCATKCSAIPTHAAAAAEALKARTSTSARSKPTTPNKSNSAMPNWRAKCPNVSCACQAIAKPEADKLTPDEIDRALLARRERAQHPRRLPAPVPALVERPLARAPPTSRSCAASRPAFAPAEQAHRVGVAVREVRHQPAHDRARIARRARRSCCLLLEACGVARTALARARLVLAESLLVAAGYAAHHDLSCAKLLALIAGLAFPALGMLAVGWAFRGDPPPPRAPEQRRLRARHRRAGRRNHRHARRRAHDRRPAEHRADDDRDRQFLGVKYVLVLPALIALALYFFTDRFGAKIDLRAAADEPVRVDPTPRRHRARRRRRYSC